MKIVADVRETALDYMVELIDKKMSFNISAVKTDNDEDNAFVTMLILTALRKLVFVRQILKKLVAKKLDKQKTIAKSALILGTVELLYMKTPDYAVINSYVDLIKKKQDRYLAGFVNAVLRRIAREKEIFTAADSDEFFPQNFRALLRKSYSVKDVSAIEKTALLQPNLDITCKNEKIKEKLGGTVLPLGTVRLAFRGKINKIEGYESGDWWVQDFSSALAVKMLGDIKDKKVLELCAAPGGKTAQLIAKGAKVDCLDVSQERLEVLKNNMSRLKMKPEKIICEDGIKFLNETDEKYDVVVLDAPCSATGTLRRHPEVVHFKTQEDVDKQAALQRKFLEKIENVLNENGILIYCTCSLCKQEGENQINEFIRKNNKYKIVNLDVKIPTELKKAVTKEGFVRILPQYMEKYGGADGFFIACLKRVV